MKDLHHIRPYHLKVQVGEEAWEETTFSAVSAIRLRLAELSSFDEARVDMRDGKFEVVLVKSPKNASEAQKIVSDLIAPV